MLVVDFPRFEQDGTTGLSRPSLTHKCYQSVYRLTDLRRYFVFVDIQAILWLVAIRMHQLRSSECKQN